jgi:hypothetical protein
VLLKRKTEPFAEWEAQAKTWRTTIDQQRNTPMLRIEIAQEITVLPYSYFQEARFWRNEKVWEITFFWPSVMVTIKGQNLQKIVRLMAEQSLAALEFRPEGEKSPKDDDPEFESVTVASRAESPMSPPVTTKSEEGPKTLHRQCYSVMRP